MSAETQIWASPFGRVGRYQVGNLLGRGGTANVYECRHIALGRRAAVKIWHPHLLADERAIARFVREGRAAAMVRHPNVVDVLDVGHERGVPYLVMSLVDGEDLGDYIRRMHPIVLADLVDRILPVVSAVAAVHDAGIVHRDLKPSNIRLTRGLSNSLIPVVLDFGISKLTDGEGWTELTGTDRALGTPSYMSPEQLRSSKDVDSRSDIYALGVILYECATGVRPFCGATTYELAYSVFTTPVTPPSSIRADLSAAFDAIVLRAMQRNASERFASVRELGRALAPLSSQPAAWLREFEYPAQPEKAIEGAGDPAFTLISESRPSVAPRRRWRAQFVAGASLGAVAIVWVWVIQNPVSPAAAPAAVAPHPFAQPTVVNMPPPADRTPEGLAAPAPRAAATSVAISPPFASATKSVAPARSPATSSRATPDLPPGAPAETRPAPTIVGANLAPILD